MVLIRVELLSQTSAIVFAARRVEGVDRAAFGD